MKPSKWRFFVQRSIWGPRLHDCISLKVRRFERHHCGLVWSVLHISVEGRLIGYQSYALGQDDHGMIFWNLYDLGNFWHCKLFYIFFIYFFFNGCRLWSLKSPFWWKILARKENQCFVTSARRWWGRLKWTLDRVACSLSTPLKTSYWWMKQKHCRD